MTVYEFLKQNDLMLKGCCRAGFVSPKFIYHVEIIDYYFLRLERGRRGSNAKQDTIEKFNISAKHFYQIKNNLLKEF